jgi:hypothetical protein
VLAFTSVIIVFAFRALVDCNGVAPSSSALLGALRRKHPWGRAWSLIWLCHCPVTIWLENDNRTVDQELCAAPMECTQTHVHPGDRSTVDCDHGDEAQMTS